MMFHFAAPLVNGFGVRTLTPGLSRSSHVWMFFGLPLRTMRLTTDFETRPFVGVFAQSFATRPALTRRSMSGASENVTTSAGRPASPALCCSPEWPKDSLNVTPLPACVFWNCGMTSSYTTCGVEYAMSDSWVFGPPDGAALLALDAPPPAVSSEPPHAATTRAATIAATSRARERACTGESSKVDKPGRDSRE